MVRFILLTFGFLGWAFYEMSGGADFQPASARVADAAPEKPVVVAIAAPQNAPLVEAVKVVPVDTTPPGFDDSANDSSRQSDMASPVSLNLTTFQKPRQTQDSTVSAVTLVPVNAGSATSSADTPAIIPSLITPNDSGIVAISSSDTGSVRTVAGNRVNVRGGPGTDYGVVTRLGRGDAVEILQDNGEGWVKMRPLEGGPEGWMADFLLTSG